LITIPSLGTKRSMTLLAKRLVVVRETEAIASSRPFGDQAGAPSNRPGTSSIAYVGFPGRTANSFPPVPEVAASSSAFGDQAKPSTFGSTWRAPCPSGPASQSAPLVTTPSADGVPTR
jgi:hypothetical protein